MKNLLISTLTALVMLVGLSSSLQAAGNLMVTPTRIVFEQRDRSAQVTLVNQSDRTSSFRISFIRQNMTASGEFIPVAEGDPGKYSDQMIRFSPRQITLPPGQSQVIRMALRRPADMADGEYRSHMLFQALPEPSNTDVKKITQQTPEGITIELIPIIGVSIPVIVRQGDLNSTVTLNNAEVVIPDQSESAGQIAVDINREGSSSAYGDLRATYTSEGATPIVISQANSVAVYSNMQTRRFEMPLTVPSGFSMEKGAIKLVFLESGATEESGVLAETRLILK